MAKQVVIKKQKVKVKKIVYPVVAACFLLALVLMISLSPNMLGLMGNSVVNSYICPDNYKLNGTSCSITIDAYKKGDANLDGKVDSNDIAYIKDHINNISPLINDNYIAADITGDNKIDNNDLSELNLYLSGMNNISEYFCPSDYDIENDKCFKTEVAISVVKDNYNVGSAVLYNGSYWYILGSGDDYITLLKKDSLSVNELSNYSIDDTIGLMYYGKEGCTNNNTCNLFSESNIKLALDNYKNNIDNELKDVNGYKIRLMTIEELSNFGYVDKTSSLYYESTSNTPYWLTDTIGDYWIMNSSNNTLNKTFIKVEYNNNNYIYETDAQNTLARVRPVINVYKNAIK